MADKFLHNDVPAELVKIQQGLQINPKAMKQETIGLIQRLLSAKPITQISEVMTTVPTITPPAADGNASTVQAAQGINAGMFTPNDPTRVTVFGGPLLDQGANAKFRIQTLARNGANRFQGHSACIAFFTDAAIVDFAIRTNGLRWIAYVTEPDGSRRRIAAQDITNGNIPNLNYYKLDFGSTAGGGRLVEIYTGQGSNYSGINVPAGFSIWPAHLLHQPRIAAVGDSFCEGLMNNTAIGLKLAMMDWFAAVFGCNNPHVNGLASTGVIANAGGNNYNTFGQRIAQGDMNASRVGHFDLIFAFGSVNDGLTAVGGPGGVASPAGDPAVQAAYKSYIEGLMVAQPKAIIICGPQQFTNSAPAIASRVLAYKAGAIAAAKGDPRVIWLESSLYERAADANVIGADGVHPGDIYGARHIGERIARQTQQALDTLLRASL